MKHPTQKDTMNEKQKKFLLRAAKTYIWWKTPEEAFGFPRRIIAQVMDKGRWEDVCDLMQLYSKDDLRTVLLQSEKGEFSLKSWHFWHYRLGVCDIGQVPALHERQMP